MSRKKDEEIQTRPGNQNLKSNQRFNMRIQSLQGYGVPIWGPTKSTRSLLVSSYDSLLAAQ